MDASIKAQLDRDQRFQPVTAPPILEAGAKEFCWISPGEFSGELVEGRAGGTNAHGSFVYKFADPATTLELPGQERTTRTSELWFFQVVMVEEEDPRSVLMVIALLRQDVSAFVNLVQEQVDSGAKFELPPLWKNDMLQTDDRGMHTALMRAAVQNQPDCAKVLLKACRTPAEQRSLVNWQNRRGQSALMVAVMHHASEDVYHALIKAGADPNLSNRHGETALMLSAKLGATNAAKILVGAGAFVSVYPKGHGTTNPFQAPGLPVADNNQATAMSLAEEGGWKDLIMFLGRNSTEALRRWTRIRFHILKHVDEKSKLGGLMDTIMDEAKRAKKERQKQQMITAELIDTERNYVDVLTAIDGIYRAEMQGHITANDQEMLFSNVERLFAANSALLAGLHSIESFSPTLMKVHFDDFLEQALDEYSKFCGGLVPGRALLKQLIAKGPAQKAHERARSSGAQARKGLHSLLAEPMQRIARYPMLLERLLKATALSHPERSILDATVNKARHATGRVNTDMESFERAHELAKLMAKTYPVSKRRVRELGLLLREDELAYWTAMNMEDGKNIIDGKLVRRAAATKSNKMSKCTGLVFEHGIIVANIEYGQARNVSDKAKFVALIDKSEYQWTLDDVTDHSANHTAATSQGYVIMWKLKAEGAAEDHIFAASSTQVKVAWEQLIQRKQWWQLSRSTLNPGNLVSMGHLYTCFEGKMHGKSVAIKMMKPTATVFPKFEARWKALGSHGTLMASYKHTLQQNLSSEAEALKLLPQHDNVLKLYGICRSEPQYIVTEMMINGSMILFLRGKTGGNAGLQMPIAHRLGLALNIARGLEALHAAGIVHRNLCASNILVGNRRQTKGSTMDAKHNYMHGYPVKISGFRFAAKLSTGLTETPGEKYMIGVSTRHLAPENLSEGRNVYSRESDVWAFGCVLAEVMLSLYKGPAVYMGLYPRMKSDAEVRGAIAKGKILCHRPKFAVEAGVWDMIKQELCILDPGKRMDIRSARKKLKAVLTNKPANSTKKFKPKPNSVVLASQSRAPPASPPSASAGPSESLPRPVVRTSSAARKGARKAASARSTTRPDRPTRPDGPGRNLSSGPGFPVSRALTLNEDGSDDEDWGWAGGNSEC